MIPAKYWSPTKKLMLLGAMAGGKAVEATATGNPLTFLTDLARPLKSLLIPFTPKQEGTGDPSPSNIRPIVPWEGLTVWNGGKNLFDKSSKEYRYNTNGQTGKIEGSLKGLSFAIKCQPNTTYTISKVATNRSSVSWLETDEEPAVGTSIYGIINFPNKTSVTITTGANAKQLFIYVNNGTYDDTPEQTIIDSIQIEVGQTATAYEPYVPITETDISFPSPVYGGVLDVVTGVLTVEYVTVDLGSLSWNYNSDRFYTTGLSNVIKRGASARRLEMYCPIFLCITDGRSQASVPDMSIYEGGNGNVFIHDSDYTDKDTFKEAMDGVTLCYPLLEPQEIQLTQQQITALVGGNTIWSDADGEMTAVFFKKA